MSTFARSVNASLNLSSRLAVVTGGSQGIGAGVAIRFAQAGSSVLVVGRSEKRLADVVAECKRVSPGGGEGKTFDYISADLSLVSGVKSALSSIETKSNGSVDYLVQTQGGPPNGAWNLTSEGIHSGFAVQILSRFLIGYELSKRGILKQSQVIVGAPGGSQTQFDVDDVELASQKDRYWIPLLVEMGKRDGLITDTYTKALQTDFPHISFYHVFPGIVTTNSASNQGFPFPLPQLFYLAGPFISRTIGNSPTSYADIPVMLAANEDGRKIELTAKEGGFLNERLKKVETSPWSSRPENQTKTKEKLLSYWNRQS